MRIYSSNGDTNSSHEISNAQVYRMLKKIEALPTYDESDADIARSLLNQIRELQRRSEEQKTQNQAKDSDRTRASCPTGFFWPKLPSGELILPQMRCRVVGTDEVITVSALKYTYDGMYSMSIEASDGTTYYAQQLDDLAPDTFESILREAAPELRDDEIDRYAARLRSVKLASTWSQNEESESDLKDAVWFELRDLAVDEISKYYDEKESNGTNAS